MKTLILASNFRSTYNSIIGQYVTVASYKGYVDFINEHILILKRGGGIIKITDTEIIKKINQQK